MEYDKDGNPQPEPVELFKKGNGIAIYIGNRHVDTVYDDNNVTLLEKAIKVAIAHKARMPVVQTKVTLTGFEDA